MLTFLRPRKSSILGLDISSKAVKLLELSRTSDKSGDHYRVESHAVEPLQSEAVVDKNIVDVEAVGQTIGNVVKRSQTKVRQAAVAVAGSAVITKVIQMSASLSELEMEGQIMLEADQHIPYPLEEVSIDFEVIGPTEKNPELVDVLLAASRSENVDNRVAALEIGGLTAAVVDVEAYAMENAFSLIAGQLPGDLANQLIVVTDIGATNTTLNVLQGGKIVYTRDQGFGGKQLTEEIERRYGLSFEEAGMAKRKGGLPDSYVTEVLEPFKEALAQQVNRSIQFFYSSSAHDEIDGVVLAGGCASIAAIDEVVEERVGTQVVIANPFTDMSVSSRVNAQNLSNDAPSLMIACGLALRSYD